MGKKLKFLLIGTFVLYMISFVSGIIIAEISFKDLFMNPNLEKIIFIICNLYIIVCFIMLISKKIQVMRIKRRLFIITAVGYIIIHILYLTIHIYKILKMYSLNDSDVKRAISSCLINPDGFVFNAAIILILLELFLILDNDKKQL